MSFEPAPPICPVVLRRSVLARIVEDIDAPNPQPGDLMIVTRDGVDRSAPWGYAYRCVGCGQEAMLPLAPQENRPAWTVTAGDPRTGAGLSLSPSIWHRDGCGWHGYLTAGRFSPC